jgi:hypothetical protein
MAFHAIHSCFKESLRGAKPCVNLLFDGWMTLPAYQERINQGFESTERCRPNYLFSIDDKRWSSNKPVSPCFCHALINLCFIQTRVETVIELCCVQTNLCGIRFQITDGQGGGFGIQQIVIFPELALIKSASAKDVLSPIRSTEKCMAFCP